MNFFKKIHPKFNKRNIQKGFIKLSKNTLVSYLIVSTVLVGSGIIFLFNPFSGIKSADAAWFNDNWAYRKELTLTIDSQSSARTNVYSLLTIDTNLTSTKLQSLCQDLRFTDINGVIIPYYIVSTSSCNTNGSNKIWLKIPTVPANTTSQIIYMYYGNPSVSAGSDINQLPLINGLNGYWKLNESSGDAADNSVNTNTLTNNNTTAYTTGQYGNAADFVAASSQTLSIADASQTGLDNLSTYTLSTWINPTATLSTGYLIIKDSTNGNCSYNVIVLSSGSVRFNSCTNGFYALSAVDSATGLITASSWQLITITYDGSYLRLYVNGVEQTSGSYPLSATNRNVANTSSAFSLGGGTINGSTGYYNGDMDDTRVYNRALSSQEIANLYNTPGGEVYLSASSTEQTPSSASEVVGPAPTLYWKFDDAQGTNADDATTNALDGTLNNTPTWQTENFCVAAKCLYFDGTSNENVSKADDAKLDFAAADNFTLGAWVKRSGASSANNFIITKAQSGYTGYKVYMDASGDLCFDVSDGTNTDSACTSAVDFDDDQWHFVSAVKAATTSITLYVDGLQRAQDASITATGTLANTGTFYTGVDLDGTSNEWLGFIDEVKVTRDQTARTATQILADYNSRSNPEGVSQQQGNNNQNMPSTLSNGLVGYWKMDESSWTNDCSTESVLDSSGNSNNGAACPNTTGPTGAATGKYSYSGSFDGSDDYLDIDNSDSLNTTGSWTVSTWFFNSDSTLGASEKYLLSKGDWDTDADSPYRLVSNFGTMQIQYRKDFTAYTVGYDYSGAGIYAIDQWIHVTGTYDAATRTLAMYFNGQLVAGPTAQADAYEGNTSALYIGAHSPGSGIWDGKIDETRIYNRPLSSSEISQLYDWTPGPIGYWKMDEGTWTNNCSANAALDASGNGYNARSCPNGTGISQPSAGKYNKAATFDGTNDTFDVTDNSTLDIGTQNFTIMAWIKSTAAASNVFYPIISKRSTTNGYAFFMRNGTLICRYLNSCTATGSTTINDNNWHHVAMRFDAGTIQFYVDGKADGSQSGITVQDAATTATFKIGADGAGSNFFNGTIDEPKIYNYARTQAQIIQDMNANHPAPGSPLSSTIATWKLDEGYGTSAQDWSGNANTLTLSTATSSWTNNGKYLKAFSGAGSRWMSKSDDGDFDIAAADSFAISMWYRSDSGTDPAATEYLIAKGPLSAAGYALYANTDGTLCFGIDDDATWNPDVSTCTATDFYDGNWHHITGVRNTATDTISIYIDGQQKDSDTDTTSATLANSGSLYVADVNGTDNGNEFVGSVDEIKFYRSALSTSQVGLDMNRSQSEVLGALSDSSTAGNDNASTRTAQSNASAYCIPGDSSTCTSPVLEYKIDEGSGTTTADSSGNANYSADNVIPGTGGAWVNGKFNKAYSFDALGTHLFAGSGSTLDNLGPMTAEAWIYPKSRGENNNAFILAKNSGNTQASGGWLFLLNGISGSTVGLQFVVDGTTDLVRGTDATAVTLNRWNHVAISWDGVMTTASTARIFVNGKEATYTTTTNGASRPSDAASSLYIGNASSTDRTFDGFIDQTTVFNYARTPAQIAWDYNQGKPIAHWKMDECQGTTISDMSGFSNTGTLTIGATGTYTTPGTCSVSSASSAWYNGASGKRNYSMAFDGTDDYITMGDVLDFEYTSPFTVSAWVKTSTATPTSVGRVIAKTEAVSGVPGYTMAIRGDVTDDPYEFELRTATSALSIRFPRPSDTNWQHVVVAYTFNNTGTWADVVSGVKAYVNGVPATLTDNSNGNPGSTTVNAGPFNIGTRNNGTNPFTGQIDDVKVYNYSLTATQVKSLYNDGAARYGPVTGAP